MPGNVALSISTLPVGFCFPMTNEQAQEFVALMSGQADVSVNVHIGEAAPADLTKLWAKTINGVPDRVYGFASGVWLAKHPIPTGFTMLAPAGHNLTSIETLDGGEAGPVTAFTGPMWQEDADFSALFPIGPGTLQSGAVINEGDAGGEEKHALTVPEIPPHFHAMLVTQTETGGGNDVNRLRPNPTVADSAGNTGSTGGDPTTNLVVPHNNLPPWRARYFIKRTARGWYRG